PARVRIFLKKSCPVRVPCRAYLWGGALPLLRSRRAQVCSCEVFPPGEHWESCEDSTMAELSLHTHEMQAWIKLWQEGDTWGADQLILAAQRRLERLAHSMLRGFPQVARQFETGDILHTALMRLLNNLREAIPASTREFFGFAAFHIRRSLIDLARSGRGVR